MSCEGPGYRHRARLSVRAREGKPRLGLFEFGSHNLVPIEGCLLHHPSIRVVLECLEDCLGRFGISAYDEKNHIGLLRAVELAASRSTGKIQIVFVLNDTLGDPAPSIQTLDRVLGALAQLGVVDGVFLNAQPIRTNTLLGARFVHISGSIALEQETLGVRNFFPPGAFGQANPALHEQVIRKIVEWVPEEARVVEYHAGVGTIGLALHAGGSLSSLVLNELSPPSLAGLHLGLQAIAGPADIRVLPGAAGEFTGLIADADVVIVDPPRKGLEESLLRALISDLPKRLVYLSCGLPAFLREADALAQVNILPRFLGAYSYFPFTDHVETLAVFERVS